MTKLTGIQVKTDLGRTVYVLGLNPNKCIQPGGVKESPTGASLKIAFDDGSIEIAQAMVGAKFYYTRAWESSMCQS